MELVTLVMAGFHLSEPVPGLWFYPYSLTDMAYWETEWNEAVTNIIYISALPALASQNVCWEKQADGDVVTICIYWFVEKYLTDQLHNNRNSTVTMDDYRPTGHRPRSLNGPMWPLICKMSPKLLKHILTRKRIKLTTKRCKTTSMCLAPMWL